MGDDVTVSWWVGLDREAFARRRQQEAARLHAMTNDPRLQARGVTEKPAVRGGRTPGAEEV
jgi:hypothetical protein